MVVLHIIASVFSLCIFSFLSFQLLFACVLLLEVFSICLLFSSTYQFVVQVKIIKCLIENIVVDISFNQLGGLCTLCFLDEVNQLKFVSLYFL